MTILSIVNGDLLDSKEHIICQQCNCVTTLPHGLSKAIANKFPHANVYGKRSKKSRNCTDKPSVPGTIQLDTHEDKTVIHMFAQWLPGKPNSSSRYESYKDLPKIKDNEAARIEYFTKCLDELDLLELGTVAMPFQIGCGLAGGNWAIYESLLKICKTNIVLYKL